MDINPTILSPKPPTTGTDQVCFSYLITKILFFFIPILIYNIYHF